MALLWIVQAALINPITRDRDLPPAARQALEALFPVRGGPQITALAHSEDPQNPVVIHDTGGKYLINGTKKYITGGTLCDCILLTMRRKGEDKISHLGCLPAHIIPEGSLVELDLKALRTTSHARLNLNYFDLPSEYIIPVEGPVIRRLIKRWSLMERALILEAYIALGMYICAELSPAAAVDPSIGKGLGELLKEQKAASRRQLEQATSGEMIEESMIDLKSLVSYITSLKNILLQGGNIPEELAARSADLDLFSLLRM